MSEQVTEWNLRAFAQRTPVFGGPTRSGRDRQGPLIRGSIVARKGDAILIQ